MLILDKLWDGDLVPSGRSMEWVPGFSLRRKETAQAEERLLELLTPEQEERFRAYDDSWVAMAAILERDAFFTGFRMAGLILLDILCGADM